MENYEGLPRRGILVARLVLVSGDSSVGVCPGSFVLLLRTKVREEEKEFSEVVR